MTYLVMHQRSRIGWTVRPCRRLLSPNVSITLILMFGGSYLYLSLSIQGLNFWGKLLHHAPPIEAAIEEQQAIFLGQFSF